MQQLKPGSKLNNKYRILRFIGQGGFAFAYEAVQEPIGLKVCIKELFIKELLMVCHCHFGKHLRHT